jgi:hypothetical protein
MAEDTQQANMFELSGGDTSVSHQSSSIAGTPQLAYTGPDGETRSFSGDDIASAQAALGSELTVTLESVPDLRTITFTLVLPQVSVSGYEQGVAIGAVGIVTARHTTIAGPGPGPEETYDVTVLEGTAMTVQF